MNVLIVHSLQSFTTDICTLVQSVCILNLHCHYFSRIPSESVAEGGAFPS